MREQGAIRRAARTLAALLAVVALAAALAALWLHGRMAACLPPLDGTFALRGLSAPVRVERDALGVPTLTGANRVDLARATGWIEAQDRYFQMDLMRRRSAGELSELFGKRALAMDMRARMHGFRGLARDVIARLSPSKRTIIEAYCEGVNAGLGALRAKPWEYSVLRTEPRPWLPEDCALVHYAMTLDLQDSTGNYVRSRAAVRDAMGFAALAFFDPLSTEGDAALDGSLGTAPPLPTAEEVDLRSRAESSPQSALLQGAPDRQTAGSNSFALAGALAGGGALLANDMHLKLGVPNTWYRIALHWPGHDETGVAIPGAPPLVAGSTGRIAWGFTNSNAGTGDIIVVDPTISPDLYHGAHGQGLARYVHRRETIAVRGSDPVSADFTWTQWGPVVGEGPGGRPLVYHWTGDDPAATNLDIMDLEDARDVDEAVAIAHRMGIPAQNFVVADSGGRIGWTVAGFLPRRVGYDGRLPVSWAFRDRRWDGFLGPQEIPTVVDPPTGILWTANNRTVGGAQLAALGDAGYDMPARARQIRDDLRALAASGRPAGPRDLLAVQLDDRAVMLEPWHKLLVDTLSPGVVAAKSSRRAVLRGLGTWEGRADAGSVSYRVVRTFRLAVAHRVFDPIFEPCVERDPEFVWTRFDYEQPLWQILGKRPPNLLDPSFASWDDLLAAAVDDVSKAYASEGDDPATGTWGQRNTAAIRHPFALMAPGWAAPWISMPADRLPGDSNMPRVQDRAFGASVRFAVAPGREKDGVFEMPAGESPNPCSPYFGAGHEAWVRGDPAPFLPGPAQHALSLEPGR
jgi:penicillin amidase